MAVDAKRVQAVFTAVFELTDADERAAALNRECGTDVQLRQRVEALLHANDEPCSIFVDHNKAFLTVDASDNLPGAVIAERYKLREQIGEGGMGVVWVAEQREPIKRLVALKLIKPGMDSKSVLARFEGERQALAIMDHPNIAKVHDGGTTAAGRPFFVMELVKGVPITDYCDQNHLTPRQRLELFISVCHAVQHAHQKGIIHRDLKPSNVMVVAHDTVPVVKVIDFGVAKALGQELTDNSLFTGMAQMIGTPLYMSPEQAGQSGWDIDTRSDIYSLGVLLYELLTGSTPFTKDRFKQAAYDEIRRIIREEEPPKPSTRLHDSHDSLPSISAQRQTEPAKLTRLMRGELDWIVMKALEKDRNRRYDSANGFAHDIQRYLGNEPVLACPPSMQYRIQKFICRNKTAIMTTTAVAAALFFAVGALGWSVRDRAARQQAAEQLEAIRQAKMEGEINRALDEALDYCKGEKLPDAFAAVKRAEGLLATGIRNSELTSRVAQVRTDLEMVVRLAQIRLEKTALDVASSRFDYGRADPLYREAFRRYGLDVADPVSDLANMAGRVQLSPIRKELAAALDDWYLVTPGKESPTAIRLLDFVCRIDPDPWRSEFRRALLSKDRKTVINMARSVDVTAQQPGTILLIDAALRGRGEPALATEILKKAHLSNPSDFWINHQLAWGLKSTHASRPWESIAYYRVAVAIRPDSPGARQNLGVALETIGDFSAAEVEFREALRLQPEYHPASLRLVRVLFKMGRSAEALAIGRESVRRSPNYGWAHAALGIALQLNKNFEGAEASYREASRLQPNEAMHHQSMGLLFTMRGMEVEAIDEFRKAVELAPNYSEARTNLGQRLAAKGLFDEAIEQYREALRVSPEFSEAYIAHGSLGVALRKKGMLAEAVTAFSESIRLNPGNEITRNNLAEVLSELRRQRAVHNPTKPIIRLPMDSTEARRAIVGIIVAQAKVAPADAKSQEETMTIEMEVKSTGGRLNFYLNSEPNFTSDHNFSVILPPATIEKFKQAKIEKPTEHFQGKVIAVTGLVTLDRQLPHIVVDDPTQIEVVESKQNDEPSAGKGAG